MNMAWNISLGFVLSDTSKEFLGFFMMMLLPLLTHDLVLIMGGAGMTSSEKISTLGSLSDMYTICIRVCSWS